MHAALPQSLGQIDLQQMEAALLDALLNFHSAPGNAVDRLLADPSLSNTDREQVEQFLLAAVTDTHPDRNRALDGILDRISKTAPVV